MVTATSLRRRTVSTGRRRNFRQRSNVGFETKNTIIKEVQRIEHNPSLMIKGLPRQEKNAAIKPKKTVKSKSGTKKYKPEIILGDCRNKLKKMDNESVHLIITDPPYFLDGLDNDWKKGNAKKKSKGVVGGLPAGMKFDTDQGRDLQDFMTEVSKSLFDVIKPGGIAIFFSQPRLTHRMAVGIEDAGFEIRDQLAWHYTNKSQFKAFSMDHFVKKKNVSEARKKQILRKLDGRKTIQLRPQFESMILAQKPKSGTHIENWLEHETGLMNVQLLNGMVPSTVMKVEKPKKSKYNDHLTVKPLQLIEYLITLFSKPNQVVLDPFLGSGTTAVAAVRQKRKCIGIEINDSYIEIANERIRKDE